MSEAMLHMCDDCPFGHTKLQRNMRNSLARGRFIEICQSIWQGATFFCHKTTRLGEDDGDGEFYIPTGQERECAGARQFLERAITGRAKAELKAR